MYKTEPTYKFNDIFYGQYLYDNVTRTITEAELYFNWGELGDLAQPSSSEPPRTYVSRVITGGNRTPIINGNAVMRLPNTTVCSQTWDVFFSRTNAGNGGYSSPIQAVEFSLFGPSNSLLPNPSTAVPETETYGMMLLGLGLWGFVARRKQA